MKLIGVAIVVFPLLAGAQNVTSTTSSTSSTTSSTTTGTGSTSTGTGSTSTGTGSTSTGTGSSTSFTGSTTVASGATKTVEVSVAVKFGSAADCKTASESTAYKNAIRKEVWKLLGSIGNEADVVVTIVCKTRRRRLASQRKLSDGSGTMKGVQKGLTKAQADAATTTLGTKKQSDITTMMTNAVTSSGITLADGMPAATGDPSITTTDTVPLSGAAALSLTLIMMLISALHHL